ncbi:MAG: hypothetical protein K8T25_14615 [Planctomycetia bacterium]|nr:hypothetical protein [Planctomycetia bacterium]
MEKLKPILAGLKKNHFWILSGVVVLVLLFAWYQAYDGLPPDFDKNKSDVKKLFEEAGKIISRKTPGRTAPEKAQDKKKDLKQQFLALGKVVEQHQAADLVWPAGIGDEFRNLLNRQGRGGAWPAERLAEFQKVSAKEVQSLRQIIDAAEGPDTPGVQWDEASFKQFGDQYSTAPANADAMFEAQERLWVAQNVLHALAAPNAGALDKFNLPVSSIEVFQVGPQAAKDRVMFSIETNSQPAPAPAPAAAPAPVPAAAPGAAPAKKAPPAVAAPKTPPPPVKQVTGTKAYPIRVRARMDLGALAQVLGILANQRLVVVIEDVHFENTINLTRKEVAPPPIGGPAPAGGMAPMGGPMANGPMANGPMANGFVAGAPMAGGPMAPAPAPAAPEGPPSLVQVPRGTVVTIQATAYIANVADLNAIKVAIRD